MRETADELFDQVVLAVTCLLNGEHIGVLTVYQRVVADALRHRGVDRMIRHALSRPSDIEPFPHPDVSPSFDGKGGR